MKVAVYVRHLAPETGGGHTYEHDIVDALAAARDTAKHEIVTAGPSPDPPDGWGAGSYVSLGGDRVGRLTGRVRRRVAATLAPRGAPSPKTWLDRLLDANGIDLIWCVAAGAPTYSLPYVTTIWDLQHRLQPVFPEVAASGEWLHRERFFAREIGGAAMVIVGTSAGGAEVERFYGVPPTRIRKLPHPTPSFALNAPAETDASALARYGLEPGFVLYPAQFWAHKNHVGLLRALRLLRDEHDVHLRAVFVGADKGNEAHVRAVAGELGLAGQVRFLGFVPRPDLVALYRGAWAMAYVTYFGPENLPPLEAFALGCPVVASDVPGADEQLGDAAVLVSPASDADIARGLLLLHRHPDLRQRLIEKGRARAEAFTAAHFVDGMFAILDELAPIVGTWR
jgi:glycosyltransferase involved in cell wall biosynthesis